MAESFPVAGVEVAGAGLGGTGEGVVLALLKELERDLGAADRLFACFFFVESLVFIDMFEDKFFN